MRYIFLCWFLQQLISGWFLNSAACGDELELVPPNSCVDISITGFVVDIENQVPVPFVMVWLILADEDGSENGNGNGDEPDYPSRMPIGWKKAEWNGWFEFHESIPPEYLNGVQILVLADDYLPILFPLQPDEISADSHDLLLELIRSDE